MRTKTLILSALLGVAGVVSSVAQNVYSVNVVGYVTLSLTNEYSLIANQLDNGNDNRVVDLITVAPAGTVVYKLLPSGAYATLTRLPTGTWVGTTTMTAAPGEGIFVRKPAAVSEIPLTFVGEVMQGTLVNPVTIGFDIYSAMVPQEGDLVTVHGYPAAAGDVVYRLNPNGTYATSTRLPTGTWVPSSPTVVVGQAFFIRSNSARDWSRVFTVQ